MNTHNNIIYKLIKNIALFIFICLITPVSYACANQFDININGNNPIIIDNANILSDYEEITLIDMCRGHRDITGFQYVLLTASDTKDSTTGHEVESVYNSFKPDITADGTIIFLISTDKNKLVCELQGYGTAKDYVTHEICDYINKQLMPYVEQEKYIEAFNELFVLLDQVSSGELAASLDAIKLAEQNSILSLFTIRLEQTMLVIFISLALSLTLVIILFLRGITACASKDIKKDAAPSSIKILSDECIQI